MYVCALREKLDIRIRNAETLQESLKTRARGREREERERVWKNWNKRSYVMNIKNRKSAEVALGKKPNSL